MLYNLYMKICNLTFFNTLSVPKWNFIVGAQKININKERNANLLCIKAFPTFSPLNPSPLTQQQQQQRKKILYLSFLIFSFNLSHLHLLFFLVLCKNFIYFFFMPHKKIILEFLFSSSHVRFFMLMYKTKS